MYDELVKRLRRCEQFRCRECEYEQVMGCRAKLNAEAADAIKELQQIAEHYRGCMNDWFEAAQDYKVAYIAEHDARIAESKSRWIPVTQRLPEEAGKYLVCGQWREKQTEIWVCEFMALGCLNGWANNAANPSVSHWMPLPEPPKEEP